MKAPPFSYCKPTSLEEVFELLEQHGEEARILAGGQSLVPTLNMRLSAPTLLIDINWIEPLKGIELRGDHLRIGALARHAEVLRSEIVAHACPLFTSALAHIGHPAVRNRGTFGGSIALADPAAELPACCVALDATIVLHGRLGAREVAADSFFLGLYDTARHDNELVKEVIVPTRRPNQVFYFSELSRRHGDFAVVGLAARGEVDGGRLAHGRLVYFGCEDRPRAIEIPADPEALPPLLARELRPMADPNGSPEMKLHLANVLARRALAELAAAAGGARG